MGSKRTTKKSVGNRRGRPPGRTSDATRDRILRAAFECFGRSGYATTTNRDIAERAGITAAAIYQHFDSKLSLYMEAVRVAHRDIIPILHDATTAAKTAREGLAALMRAYATAYARDASVAPFLSTIPIEMQRHTEIAEAMKREPSEVLRLIVDTVGRGADSGEISPENAQGVVSMFLACTMGLSLHAALLGQDHFADAVEASARLIEGTLIGEARRISSVPAEPRESKATRRAKG